jgi:hypothetical protein
MFRSGALVVPFYVTTRDTKREVNFLVVVKAIYFQARITTTELRLVPYHITIKILRRPIAARQKMEYKIRPEFLIAVSYATVPYRLVSSF